MHVENTRVGPFQVLEKLGNHKRHSVFRAVQVDQQREVALKFIKVPPEVGAVKALVRIQRETKILKKLVHPGLVRIHGAGVEDGRIFFAMELVRGESLAAILTRRNKLRWDVAAEYAKQIASVLEYIHGQEVIHLKLTPEKILVSDEGQIKVSDLRLNRSKRRRWDASDRKSLDVAAYMPPEQFAGQRGTAKSDFYALGVIMFEMITGKLPFTPDSLAHMVAQKTNFQAPKVSEHTMDCPIWLEQLISQLLESDPMKRPHSARAIILALQEIEKIEKKGASAAETMSGSFSPLTMHRDKREARKLLGIKEDEEKPAGPPFYTSIPFLVTCLVLMAIAIGFVVWPESESSMHKRAAVLLESTEHDDLLEAKDILTEQLKQFPEGELAEESALELREVRKKLLLKRAESTAAIHRTAPPFAERDFILAMDLEAAEDWEGAKKKYHLLVRSLKNDPDHAYVEDLARIQLQGINRKLNLIARAKAKAEGKTLPEDGASDSTTESDADSSKPVDETSLTEDSNGNVQERNDLEKVDTKDPKDVSAGSEGTETKPKIDDKPEVESKSEASSSKQETTDPESSDSEIAPGEPEPKSDPKSTSPSNNKKD
jgi:eukaryotic-like serine/threonine-protein kinase